MDRDHEHDQGQAAHQWYLRGYRLHTEGDAVAAEEAYRWAIAGGRADANLHLALLLETQPGRLDDEETALRIAITDEDDEIAAAAALRLGQLLEWVRDDLPGARACYEIAEERGTDATSFWATLGVARTLGRQGDIEAADDRLRSFAVWYGDQRDVDMVGEGAQRLARVYTTLTTHDRLRDPFHRFLRRRYLARRRKQSRAAAP